jgi:hypothetical protein
VRSGELLMHHQAGGGHGDPFTREPDSVARDVWNGKATLKARCLLLVTNAAVAAARRGRTKKGWRRLQPIFLVGHGLEFIGQFPQASAGVDIEARVCQALQRTRLLAQEIAVHPPPRYLACLNEAACARWSGLGGLEQTG